MENKEILITNIRNGDDIDFYLIKYYEDKVRLILEPFVKELTERNERIILKIFKTPQDIVRAEIDYSMLHTQPLSYNVQNALSEFFQS